MAQGVLPPCDIGGVGGGSNRTNMNPSPNKKKRTDQDGLPVCFQLSELDYWKEAMAGWISVKISKKVLKPTVSSTFCISSLGLSSLT